MNCTDIIREKAAALLREQDTAVIGIDGLGGAGKSTVSEQVCAALEADGIHTLLLHIDDFIHPRAVRYNDNYPEWQCYYDLQWRYDHFADVLRAVKAGADAVEAELYDKENDSYFTRRYTLHERTAVIVEGIFLQRGELRGLFDCMVYIDVPEDERLGRVLRRDTYIGNERQIAEKYEKRYFPAERRYFEACRPERSADIVVR